MTGWPRGFGKTREGDPQPHGVDGVTRGLPPGPFGEELARITCEPSHSARVIVTSSIELFENPVGPHPMHTKRMVSSGTLLSNGRSG